MTNEDSSSQESSKQLEHDVKLLHEEFHVNNQHLSEVRDLHTRHLVTAGMIPETHIAKTNPERALAWLVEELNATKNPDGLTIPMKGVAEHELQITESGDENQKFIDISINNPIIGEFQRKIPIPKDSSDWSANFVDGNLRLRW